MEKQRHISRIIGRFSACIVGTVLFLWGLAPLVFSGIWNVGVMLLIITGFILSLGGVAFLPLRGMLGRMWKRKGLRILLTAFSIVLILLLLLFIAVSAVILHAAAKAPPENATVIVLGAALRGDRPSTMLRDRLDAAIQYLKKNEEAVCIVSGGQGADEIQSEASVMKAYLQEKGIAESRIYVEDRSTSTYENIAFSKEIIQENGLNPHTVIATQEFHQFRAQSFAKRAGLDSVGACTCRTPPYLLGCYWVREFGGICRMLLLGY